MVREGMSVGENRVMRGTLHSDDTRIVECKTDKSTTDVCSECCEFRQVYSSFLFIITTSHYQFT